MVTRALCAVVALLAIVSQGTSAQSQGLSTSSAVPIQPTGEWTVQTLSNECLLARPYGTTKAPLFLTLTQAPMGGGSEFSVLAKSSRRELKSGSATIFFEKQAPIPTKFNAMLLRNPSKKIEAKTLRNVAVYEEHDSSRLAQNAASVTLVVPNEVNQTFGLPGHDKALAALAECASALGVKWGYTKEEQSRLARPADSPNGLQSLFNASDYPADAHWRGEQGRARIRISVGENGHVTDCSVLASTGSDSLDSATCSVVRSRAEFSPAVDVDGKFVRSVVVTTVYWILM